LVVGLLGLEGFVVGLLGLEGFVVGCALTKNGDVVIRIAADTVRIL
jgi:hypothetical protein